MAILARAMVTLASIKDVASVTRFYKLLSSTASKPSVPTTNPPDSSWSTTEPTYSEETTSTLYFVDLTVFSDGSYAYSDVSQSTSYEAAKSAYNVAQNAKDVADSAQDSIDNLKIGGRNLLYNSSFSKNFDKWARNVAYDMVVEDGYTCGHITGNSEGCIINQNIIDRIKEDDSQQIYTISGDIKLVNYEGGTGTTDPYLAFYFSGHYDKDGVSTWTGVKGIGGNVQSNQEQFVPFNNQGWVRAYYIFKFTKSPSVMTDMKCDIYVRNWSGDLYFKNLKLERGNKATDWSPAPEDFNEGIATISNNLSEYINSTEIVVGTQTAATGSWTGNAGFSELKDGQQIAYWLPYAGSGSASLNLTLSDGTTTGAKNVYYRGSTRANTHFVAGSLIHLTYRVDANVNGSNYTGWWADASYDSGNTYNRIRFENAVLAKTAISASRFIVGDDEGFFHLVGNSIFDITKPILWAASAISEGDTATTNYLAINSATLRNNLSGVTLSKYQTCYLVGNLTGKLFTVKSTEFFTSTIPTTDDGYYYISLGYLYSTYQIYLYPEHPIYKFVDGEFKNLNQVAYEANIKAIEAKDDIDNLSIGGRNLLLDSEDERVSPESSGNSAYVATHRVSDYGKQFLSNTTQVFTVSVSYEVLNNTSSGAYIYALCNGTSISGSKLVNYYGDNKSVVDYIDVDNPTGVYRRSFTLTDAQAETTLSAKAIRFRMRYADDGAVLKVKNAKLEIGNRATDWTPAPEDIDESINSVTIESTSDNFINYTFDGSKIYYPSTITLTPFINGNIEFSKWQYKLINSDTWIDVVSGSNGLTVESDNTLTISNSCSLFTDTCSAIVFKCLSNNSAFYSSKTIVREDDPTRVYNTVKTRVDQTDDNLSLIASATELAEYSTSSTLNSRLANVSVSSDEILMVVSQSVNNLSTANGIKGVYDESVSYATNNIVVLNGKFYKAKKASTGKTPPNTTYWTDVTSQYSETTLKTAFSKIVALQDSITLQVSGSNGNSSINLTDGTLSLTVTDVANILANKVLNLTSENGVINITGGGGVNIGTNNLGALNIQSPNFKLTDSGYIISSRGLIGNWEINENVLSSFKIFENGQPLDFPNSWISGYHYRVGDHVTFYNFSDRYTNYSYSVGTCIKDHISNASNAEMSEYWDTGGIVDEVAINGIVYTTVIDSYNSKITLDKINVGDLDSENGHTTIEAGNILVDDISIEKYKIRCDNANNDLTIESQNDIVLNNAKIGNVSISSIGDGSITGAISTLNTNKSNALSTVSYNAADETIQTSEMKEFSINIASNGKTAIGIIGCIALGSASACLCGFWLDSDTTAKVRIRNMSNTSIVCHPRVIILYVDN